MDFSSKPTWLRSHSGLLNTIKFHLFPPKNMGEFSYLADASAFNRGIKQFMYWKGQLLPSTNKNIIFLAFLGQQGLMLPNVINVIRALKKVCDLSLLLKTYTGANTNFLAFSFSGESPVKDILQKFIYFEDSVVLPIVHTGDNTHRFRLLWLPPLFDVARVHHLLSSFSVSHQLRRESISIGDGQYSNTNVIAGTLTLKPGTSVDHLPHLIKLPSPHKGSALLYIESRPPLCLKCRVVGHTRKKCTMVRCATCLKVHFPSSACGTSSYSSVASKGLTIVPDDDWIANINEESIYESGVPLTSEDNIQSTNIKINVNIDVPSDIPSSLDKKFSSSVALNPIVSEKCDRTSIISSRHTFSSDIDTASCFNEFTSGLLGKESASLDSPLGQCTSEKAIPSTSNIITPVSHDHAPTKLSSPPLTRSRSHKKQVISSSDHHRKALRSEMITFMPHSSSHDQKESSSSFITSHFSSFDASCLVHNASMDSSSSDVGVTYSDIEVDLSTRDLSQDASTTRKRKLSRIFAPDSASSLDGDSMGVLPSTVSVLSPSDHDIAYPINNASSVPDFIEPDLSNEDKRIADLFSISPSELLSLKAVCPGHDFSAIVIKKLRILHNHSISVLQVINHTQFFNLTTTAITNRIKTLERHHTSTIQVSDLFQTTDKFDRMEGIPGARLTPQLCSPDPFKTKS